MITADYSHDHCTDPEDTTEGASAAALALWARRERVLRELRALVVDQTPHDVDALDALTSAILHAARMQGKSGLRVDAADGGGR